MFYNTSITSIVGWRILELPVLFIDQWFWYSSIVNARYWYIQYCIYTILDFWYCNITILVFLVLYSVTILVLPVYKYYNTGNTSIAAGCFILSFFSFLFILMFVLRFMASCFHVGIVIRFWSLYCLVFRFIRLVQTHISKPLVIALSVCPFDLLLLIIRLVSSNL